MIVVPGLARLLAEGGPGTVTGLRWAPTGHLVVEGLAGAAEITLTGGQQANLRRLTRQQGEAVVVIVDHFRLLRVEVALLGDSCRS